MKRPSAEPWNTRLPAVVSVPPFHARGKGGVNRGTKRIEKEKICLVRSIPPAKYGAHSGCNAATENNSNCFNRLLRQGPLSAIPRSTGCSATELQRQPPPSIFWKANDFSIFILCATAKLSLPGAGDCLALPDFKSQHVPVQPDAIGLQAANGESTTISTSAFTRALCADASLSSWVTRLTRRKFSQALAEWICATHKSTASASGEGEGRFSPKIRFGSPLAAMTCAVFSLKYSARQSSDGGSSSSGTLSFPARPHFRSRALVHRAYSANASLASSSFSLPIRATTWSPSSLSAMANEGSLQISIP